MPPTGRSGKAWTGAVPPSETEGPTIPPHRPPVPSFRAALLILLLLIAPAGAEAPLPAPPPVLQATGVPGLGPSGQRALSRLVLRNLPRVFVIGPGGAYAFRAGPLPVEELERLALEACQTFSRDRAPCIPWLRNLDIAWPGREWTAPSPPEDLGFGDARHVTLPDPRFLWWGPGRARGVLVWAHGRNADGADSRGSQPQAWVRQFNNAGFDIWRFDRAPETDFTRAAGIWLRTALAELRRSGYAQVLAAGQSRGGWNALQTLVTPHLADAVIAIAPAALASMEEAAQAAQLEAFRRLVAAADGAARSRVAVANFRGDPFDGVPEERAAVLRALADRTAAFLLIDRPEGIEGHDAGRGEAFTERFGPCLFRFVTAETQHPAC